MASSDRNFTLIWRIENFIFNTKTTGASIESPKFTIEPLFGSSWLLKCFPRGIWNSAYVSVDLCRLHDDGEVKEIEISGDISFLGNDGSHLLKEEVKEAFTASNQRTIFSRREEEFMEEENLFLGDTLTVVFQMYINDFKSNCKDFIDCNEDTLLINAELRNMLSKLPVQSMAVNELCSLYPSKCLARTVVAVERRTIHYAIEDFSELKRDYSVSFPIDSAKERSISFFLTIRISDASPDIEIYITQSDPEKFVPFCINCNICLIDVNGTPFSLVEEQHVFESKKKRFWETYFKKSIIMDDRSLYLPYDVLSLRVELLMSGGTEISKMDELRYPVLKPVSKCKRPLLEDLLHFYSEQKFCDVTIRVGGDAILAHKVVLCSRSPVLRTLIEEDNSGRTNDVIDVNDVDMDTFKQMLMYMYSERIGNLELKDEFKLYAAAVKYQYDSLKRECASDLSSGMQLNSACDVLSLSDLHRDQELKKFTLDYIYLHAYEVLRSYNWNCLIQNNSVLASECLSYISKKMIGG